MFGRGGEGEARVVEKFYAHSGKNPDKSDWQGLEEHLLGVAEEFLQKRLGLECRFAVNDFCSFGNVNIGFISIRSGFQVC